VDAFGTERTGLTTSGAIRWTVDSEPVLVSATTDWPFEAALDLQRRPTRVGVCEFIKETKQI
jgi:hypothetical protein